MGELAKLRRRQHAVGNGDPKHVGVELDVKPVHQPQGLELVLGDLAGHPPGDLVAELLDPFVDQPLVQWIIAVHGLPSSLRRRRRTGAMPRRPA